ncbi:hypothetical protein G3576_18060 [Roseomonas stagni]|uniref:Uncharacterized protein n=1 Tax=Falsiroseomonas algicola TaxID=2716930 RepID=A0A6M1LNI9_9PROT|nr:hypothetical protein [Falsiroseomonas algicola]NGM21935.1 hypothetical protein [Falsiroseomonas algicola]
MNALSGANEPGDTGPKPITKDIRNRFSKVDIYKDDLEEIHRILTQTVGSYKLSTNDYEYSSVTQLIETGNDPRPKKIDIVADNAWLFLYLDQSNGATVSATSLARYPAGRDAADRLTARLKKCARMSLPDVGEHPAANMVLGIVWVLAVLALILVVVEFAGKIAAALHFPFGDLGAGLVGMLLGPLVAYLFFRQGRSRIFVDKARLEANFWEKHGGAFLIALIGPAAALLIAAIQLISK